MKMRFYRSAAQFSKVNMGISTYKTAHRNTQIQKTKQNKIKKKFVFQKYETHGMFYKRRKNCESEKNTTTTKKHDLPVKNGTARVHNRTMKSNSKERR